MGLFTIGGGYAMLPIIQEAVCTEKGWLTDEEFLDSISLTNSLPGPLATNCATFIGYRLKRVPGSIAAILGTICPSIIIILLIAMVFNTAMDNAYVQAFFRGVGPAVFALIVSAVYKLATKANIMKDKLKDKFGVDVNTVPQKIAYRETIKGTSDVQGKHKKQTGGAGQYGDVWIRFSPSEEEFEFGEELFGGSVPKNYVPAVEKGLRECMEKGPLAGCKVQNVKAILYDGSYHEVDSNEMAFKIAASLAFKKGIAEANPCLLEPIMKLEIKVPDDYVGAVMGDLPNRRGAVLGMEPIGGGIQKLMAEAPQAELLDYAIALRTMTQARGSFEMEFSRHDPVPNNIAQKIIADYKASLEEK